MSRILAIEDSPSIRLLLQRRLGRAGHRVDSSAGPIGAIRTLGRGAPSARPDLILLDLGLPGIDGITALEEIAKVAPEVPVVLLSARPDLDRIEMPVAPAGRIAKPIDFDQLLELIDRLT